MINRLVLLLAFSAVVLLGQSQTKYDKTYNLKYNLQKDASFILHSNHYYIVYDLENDSHEPRVINGYMDMRFRVVEVVDGVLMFEVEYADKHNENRVNKQVNATGYDNVVGKKVRYAFSNTGKVSQFENINVQLDNANPRLLTQLEEEIIHMLPTLPGQPVRIGNQWTTSFGNDNDDFEDFSLVYTLLDEVEYRGHKCVKIIANYKTHNSRDIPKENDTLKLEANDTGHDIYFFAYEEGMLISRKSIGSGTRKVFRKNGELFRDLTNDVLYETNVEL